MMREDESEAAKIDADLDAKEAERKVAAAAATAEAGRAEEPDGTKPWWEDDPRFTGRFKAI